LASLPLQALLSLQCLLALLKQPQSLSSNTPTKQRAAVPASAAAADACLLHQLCCLNSAAVLAGSTAAAAAAVCSHHGWPCCSALLVLLPSADDAAEALQQQQGLELALQDCGAEAMIESKDVVSGWKQPETAAITTNQWQGSS
jgi:hypothetical protein